MQSPYSIRTQTHSRWGPAGASRTILPKVVSKTPHGPNASPNQSNASPNQPNANPNASCWNIVRVWHVRVGHVVFMLFVSILFMFGSQR